MKFYMKLFQDWERGECFFSIPEQKILGHLALKCKYGGKILIKNHKIAENLKMSQQQVHDNIKKLINKNIIKKVDSDVGYCYEFNEKYITKGSNKKKIKSPISNLRVLV